MFFVFKNPFRYAVAGYGVFNCVKGGVNKKTVASNLNRLIQQKYLFKTNMMKILVTAVSSCLHHTFNPNKIIGE